MAGGDRLETMQDHTHEDFDPEVDRPSRFGRVRSAVSTAIGALVAMALLMALGIWFYRLGVRDAQNVPIIRASLEPEKERPADPGGLVAPHQEIESYDVAGNQPAASAAAVVAAQPPQPRPEDVPMAALQPIEAQPEPEPQPAQAVAPSEAAAPANEAPRSPAEVASTEPGAQTDQQLALNETAVTEPQPTAPVETEAEPAVVESEDPAEIVGATAYAPTRSPVALPRPANLKARIVAAAETEEQSQVDLVKAAASSRVQIQLAADPSETGIRSKWRAIQQANDDILHNRALAVQTTVSGGTTFYRLRVGPFRSAEEARSVCQALKGRGQDCIVARNN